MMLAWFRDQGVDEVRIHYQVSNTRGGCLLERIGFSPDHAGPSLLYLEKTKKAL